MRKPVLAPKANKGRVAGRVTLKPDFKFDEADEAPLLKELVLQVRKTIGPFAAPKRIVLVSDLPQVSRRT